MTRMSSRAIFFGYRSESPLFMNVCFLKITDLWKKTISRSRWTDDSGSSIVETYAVPNDLTKQGLPSAYPHNGEIFCFVIKFSSNKIWHAIISLFPPLIPKVDIKMNVARMSHESWLMSGSYRNASKSLCRRLSSVFLKSSRKHEERLGRVVAWGHW